MSDEETPVPPEALEAILGEDTTDRHYAINAKLLEVITKASQTLMTENPSFSQDEIIFEVTLKTLRNPLVRFTNRSMVPEIVVYYLQAYDRVSKAQSIDDAAPDYFLNKALLSLILLYTKDHYNKTKRNVLKHALLMIRDFVSEKVGTDTKVDSKTAAGVMFNLSLLAESVDRYTTGFRRAQNLAYFVWLSDILRKVLINEEYLLIVNDPQMIAITKQITKRQKTLTLITH